MQISTSRHARAAVSVTSSIVGFVDLCGAFNIFDSVGILDLRPNRKFPSSLTYHIKAKAIN